MTKNDKVLSIFTILCVVAVVVLIAVYCWPKDTDSTIQPTATSWTNQTALASTETPELSPTVIPTPSPVPLPEGFSDVLDYVPDAGVVLSYYTDDNFTGRRVPGYETNRAILTTEACKALKEAADALREQGYRIYIFDAYRPVDAVQAFVAWGQDEEDTLRKEDFYPTLTKKQLFNTYISSDSKHSRGSTIDLTLMRLDGSEVMMGCHFDYFNEIAHTFTDLVDAETHENRMILRRAMESVGFEGSSTEWWHFHLINEPYPDTAFNFYVK